MHIQKLTLIDFKNYVSAALTFDPSVNCIVGSNGSGKTNILEAIHYLSMTRGAINLIDSQNIRTGQPYFSIKGAWSKSDRMYDIVCYLQSGSKKSFKVNKQEYDKLSEHIGKFPVVLITPFDTDLIREGSEIRRKFFDAIICQLDSDYLDNLMRYNHVLKQRNAYLKARKGSRVDQLLIEQYDDNLDAYASIIYEGRRKFVDEYNEHFKAQYQMLSQGKEEVAISYQSDLAKGNLKDLFQENLQRDLLLERTTVGVHRDDYKFRLENHPVKKYGSQGQQKTFVIALKLAQFEVIRNRLGLLPVLLLDDIFDKLDNERIAQLLELIGQQHFGQVVITDAREDRTISLIEQAGLHVKIIRIEQGEILES